MNKLPAYIRSDKAAGLTAKDVTTVAEHFAGWLEGTEEPAFTVTNTPEANLGLASTEDLLRELDARGRFFEVQGQEQGRFLSAYTVDVSNRLTAEALAYRTADTAGTLHYTPNNG